MAQVQQKTGLPRGLVLTALRDIIRFIGEGVFKGVSFVLDFPSVGRMYLKANKCKLVFAEGLVSALGQNDANRALHSHRKHFSEHRNQVDNAHRCFATIPSPSSIYGNPSSRSRRVGLSARTLVLLSTAVDYQP